VRRLNTRLLQVGFGNIARLRVELRRLEPMENLLKSLMDSNSQEALFQSNIPIEEALNELFRRHSGGKLGGLKLLDYREYIELVVEVQRRSSTNYEVASPAKLSTGESIGVGAALMMVILSEWEHDARLLRKASQPNSLRFLFLDEANRLSKDNLAVLFDLCRTLELQLLIAAPEVAQAEGNTTYRLVRTVDATGREEVLVSGRRMRKDPPVAEAAATALLAETDVILAAPAPHTDNDQSEVAPVELAADAPQPPEPQPADPPSAERAPTVAPADAVAAPAAPSSARPLALFD
jgi:chromosome partition protein MukB